MKKIVVACDSFKGSLSSREVAEAVGYGIRNVFPSCKVVNVPVADGGEGTVEALVDALHGKMMKTDMSGPILTPVTAEYGISRDGKTAIMEMASASGLTLLPPSSRNPLLTTTQGVGEMIRDAIKRGCRKVLIGIGGSATNDCGLGMLMALGFRFFDESGNGIHVGCGKDLERVTVIDDSDVPPAIRETEFIVACDVNNPLYGTDGAAYVFARQKGADDEMIVLLDKGMRHFSKVVGEYVGKDMSATPGAGAAGGLGFAFLSFLNASLKPGVDMVLDAIQFDDIIKEADLVITGEGKIDKQTSMGKTPLGVMYRARKQGIQVIAIGGSVEDSDSLCADGFTAIFPIQPGPISLEAAMKKDTAYANIKRTITQIMRLLDMTSDKSQK